jgi:DNA replication and repair protein RecF
VQGLEGRSLIEVEIRTVGANRVQVNRSPVRRKRDVRKLIRGVFFGPDDLAIVQGDPGERRRFLDEAVVTLWPARETAMNAYVRTVRQRNRLLKDWMGSGAPQGIEAWDEELIQHGSAVIRTRTEAIERLAPHAAAEFKSLSGSELAVEYRPSVQAEDAELEETFRLQLDERRDDELVRRTTLVGPHRDDVHLGVRDLTARGFASHGEAWGAALSLRLGLATAVSEEVGEAPVVLLDDPFSALDPVRRAQVADGLSGRGQIVVSVADSGHVPLGSDLIWRVSDGSVEVESEAGGKGGLGDAVE